MTPTQVPELPEWLRGERARPTLPALVGAAGALVALVGTFLLLEGVDTEDLRAFGIALASFTLLVGCVLMLVERRGALRTAGVTLAAGAVVPLALVLVNDPTDVDSRTDVLLTGLVAVLVWLVLFAFSPARGHGLFLGLALLGAWLAAVSQTAPASALFWIDPFTAARASGATVETVPVPSIVIPEQTIPTFTVPTFRSPPFTVPTIREPVVPFVEPGTTTEPTFPPFPVFREEEPQESSLGGVSLAASTQPVERPREPPIAPAVVSILFGVVYLALAALLDQARLARLAGAFVAVGVPVLAFGVVFIGPRHGATPVALAAVAFGLVLLAVGVGGGRRFSGWAGAAVLAGGALGLVGETFDDPGSGDAVAMLLVGAALVAAAWFAGQAAHDSSS